jgi:hypothetical protein
MSMAVKVNASSGMTMSANRTAVTPRSSRRNEVFVVLPWAQAMPRELPLIELASGVA